MWRIGSGIYWSAEASDSIPALLSREAGGVATVARPDGHVGEGLVRLAVQPRVEETERLLVLSEQSIVDERDDGRESRAGSGRAADGLTLAGPDDDVLVALSSNVRVGATGLVVQAIVQTVQTVEVGVDGLLLVVWGGEVVAEAGTRGEALDSDLGIEVGCGADGGDPWAAGRERGAELGGVESIVGEAGAVSTYASVTG